MSTNQRQSYPLTTMFLLLALCAVLAAMWRPIIAGMMDRNSPTGSELAAAMLAGVILVSGVGIFAGLRRERKLTGILLGGLLGSLTGACLGPLFVADREAAIQILATALVGAAVLIVAGACVGMMSSNPSDHS